MKKMFLSVVSQLVLPFFTDGTKRSMILCFSLLSAANVAAQVQVSGKLVDDRKAPVEFANIVFQSGDSFQGTVSDEEGKFSIGVSAGDYAFRISVIGYAHFEKALSIREDTDLGEIVLTPSTVDIGEVTVKAQRTVRKSDRFVINLANDPGVFGKTGSDILSMSPGVFVQERDGTVSINGKSGTRVTVNGRLLREQGADLIRYLQTLRAEDILRIEILPAAGAGFDADIAGGVIGITLKRLRDDGLNGNAALLYALAPGEDVFSLSPSFGMNY
ncbi:MAG: carboxypeptidase-like regulatory domain-containing protein, partial [Tannerella sp.]|nr:carboxypeptidase-like regulatory domain-containing protein [Tannerella sp.]